ncbi:MAG: right-handed parallel beta-helix repeat-containing protein, partial [Bacteroidia bacterium]
NNDVEIEIYNNGEDTIKSGQIDWWINGVKQNGTAFNSTILPENTGTINLGNYNFGSGSHNVVVVVDSINGLNDESKSDTFKIDLKPGLVGNYTIGGTNADFANFAEAVSALNSRGLCGSVNFTINNGTYSGTNLLSNIKNSSKSNTITFNGQDSSKTIIANNASSTVYTLGLQNVDWITFKNIQFQSSRWAVYLSDNCNRVNFENCYFNQSTTGTSGDVFGIVASSISTSEAGYGDNVQNLSVSNCLFSGGERSIQIMGNQTSSSQNIAFENNEFKSAYYSFLGLYNCYNVKINGNTFTGLRQNAANAIVGYSLDNLEMKQNFVAGRNYAIYFQDLNLYGNKAVLFENNIITSTTNGVYFNNLRTTSILHNTIVGTIALRLDNQSGIDLRNNILYGLNNYAFYCLGNSGFTNMDWNHYYSNATNKYAFDNTAFSSLSNWQAAFGEFNVNSVEGVPQIISTSNPYLKTNAAASRGLNLGINLDIDSETRCEFPSIGADESKYNESKPTVKFTLPDTSYTNAIVATINSANYTDLLNHEWFVNDVKVDSTNLNLNYSFSSTGRYKITLRSSNCSSFDTTSKFIVIKPVSKAPVAQFTASATTVKSGEIIELENTSLNGPSEIYWSISPYFETPKSRTYFFTTSTDSITYSPSVYFNTPGDYTVCLYVKNAKGDDQKCKEDHITVIDEATMCNQSLSYVSSGIIRDPGGLGDYAGRANYNCTYTIAPCAKNLRLTFTEFDIINNRDYLRIYDGEDSNAPALHDYATAYNNGLTGDDQSTNFKNVLVAKSGKAHLQFTTNWFFGSPGFEIEWSSTPLNVAKPVADFDIPDTICVGTELNIENKSIGQGNRYNWQILSKVTNTVDYTDSAVTHFFFFQGAYTVRLIVENCGGSDTIEKDIRVVEATSKPTAKIHVDIPNPDKGQVVTLSDVSTLKGYLCSEYRTWSISPSSFSYETGFNSQNQITKVTFRDTGCYDIQLVASNSNGLDTILVKCAVRVIDRCTPTVGSLNEDIGIARVALGTINNSSLAGTEKYTDYRAST